MATSATAASMPFVHLFRTEQGAYVYDVNTNRIVAVKPGVQAVLRHYATDRSEKEVLRAAGANHPDMPHEQMQRAYQDVQQARRRGLFSNYRPEDFTPWHVTEQKRATYATGLQQLILELTEQCNMRCRYCTFSEHYPLTRGYSQRGMPVGVALAAITYFLEHSTSVEGKAAVTFYGGEPLLRMDLLERSCRLAMEKAGERVRFQLTTNGTLLTAANAKRLAALDMTVLVSLDGPQAVQDTNRVLRNGNGSFARVFDNLRAVRRALPEFYQRNLGFVCVLGPRTSPKQAFEFFESEPDLLGNGILVVNFVSAQDTDYWERHPTTPAWRQEVDQLRVEYYRRLLSGGARSKFLDALFQKPFLSLWRRGKRSRLPATMPLHGCCVPGSRRLFVDVHGQYHICERVNRTIPIGDVAHGLDLERVRQIWDRYRDACRKSCLGCWALQYCPRCFVAVGKGEFALDASECDRIRDAVASDMEDFCRIAERNPFAFEFMREIKVR